MITCRYLSLYLNDVRGGPQWVASCVCGFRGGAHHHEVEAIREHGRHARALRSVERPDHYRPSWAYVYDYLDACGYHTPALDQTGQLNQETKDLCNYLAERSTADLHAYATDLYLIAGVIAIACGRGHEGLMAEVTKLDAPNGRAALR